MRPHPLTVADDLPLKSISYNILKNAANENFKRSLPIYRTHINYYFHQIHSIGKEQFSIYDLQQKFKSPAWQDASIWEQDSNFL